MRFTRISYASSLLISDQESKDNKYLRASEVTPKTSFSNKQLNFLEERMNNFFHF